MLRASPPGGRIAIVQNLDRVALQTQIVLKRNRDRRVVFYDEYPGHGSTKVNVLPLPGSLSKPTRPPWASAIRFTRASPSPTPPAPARLASAPRTNFSKM